MDRRPDPVVELADYRRRVAGPLGLPLAQPANRRPIDVATGERRAW